MKEKEHGWELHGKHFNTQHGPPGDLHSPRSRRSNTVWYRRRAESPIQHGKSTGRAALSGLQCSCDNFWQLRRLKGKRDQEMKGGRRRGNTTNDRRYDIAVVTDILFILYYSSCIPTDRVWRIPRRILLHFMAQAASFNRRWTQRPASLPTDHRSDVALLPGALAPGGKEESTQETREGGAESLGNFYLQLCAAWGVEYLKGHRHMHGGQMEKTPLVWRFDKNPMEEYRHTIQSVGDTWLIDSTESTDISHELALIMRYTHLS